MSPHTIWRFLFLVVPLALIAGFLFRPTPLLGIDGESLAASSGAPVNEVNSVPCAKQGENEDGQRWTCTIPGLVPLDEESPPAAPSTYSLTVDWLGCWTVESTAGNQAPPEAKGCVTLADHVESID